MTTRGTVFILFAALLQMTATPRSLHAESRSALPQDLGQARTIQLRAAESRVLDIPGLKRVSITDPKVADVVVVAPDEIRLDGLSAGSTTLYTWDSNGRVRYDVDILPRKPVPTESPSTTAGSSLGQVLLATADGALALTIPVGRVGWLAGGIEVRYRSLKGGGLATMRIPKDAVTGFFNAHQKLLVYVSTLVDEREAILDVEYDYSKKTGTASFRLTPAAIAGLTFVPRDEAPLFLGNLQLKPHEYK